MSKTIAKHFRHLFVIGCITINIRIFMLSKLVKLFFNTKGHFRKAAEILFKNYSRKDRFKCYSSKRLFKQTCSMVILGSLNILTISKTNFYYKI